MAERPKHVGPADELERRTQPEAPSARRAISESDDALAAATRPASRALSRPDPYLLDEPTARGPSARAEEPPRVAPAKPAPPRVPVVAVGGAPSSVGSMRLQQKTLVGGLDVAVARAALREHAGGSSPAFEAADSVATDVASLGMPGSAIVTPMASTSRSDLAPETGEDAARARADVPTIRPFTPAAFVSNDAAPDASSSAAVLPGAEASSAALVVRPRSSSASWSSVRMPTASAGRRPARVGLWVGAGALTIAAAAGVFFVREGFSTEVTGHGEPSEATSDRIARDATIRGRAARPTRGAAPAATPAFHKPARPTKRR